MKHLSMLVVLLLVMLLLVLTACRQQADSHSVQVVSSEDDIRLQALKHRSGAEDPLGMVRIYPFKRAKFVFDISGTQTRSGTLTMVVDEFGHFESKKSEKVDFKGQQSFNWTVKRGLDLWHLDPSLKEATLAVMKSRQAAGIDMDALTSAKGSPEAVQKFLQESNTVILPDEIVAGYRCQVIRQDMESYALFRWVYQGVELRMAVQFPGKEPEITRDLLSVDFDPVIPEGIFRIRDDYAVQTTLSVGD